jgi:translation initiation factor 1A
MLGNGRLEAQCFDGEKRLAHIRGKMRKKVWINQGDIILLSLREFQDAKADVILKYSADEARNVKAYGELPETAKINETDTFPADGDDEVQFDFDIEDVCSVCGFTDFRFECLWRFAHCRFTYRHGEIDILVCSRVVNVHQSSHDCHVAVKEICQT